MARASRYSRATWATSSISAPARSIVAGAVQRPGMSGHSWMTSTRVSSPESTS